MSRLLCLSLVLFMAASALAQTPAPAPAIPEPEQYLADGRYPEYVKDAQSYLDKNAAQPAAPRVAMDLLVTATVYNDQLSANMMRKTILSEYPTSTQAKYVIGELTDGGQFATLMSQVADDSFETMAAGFADRFDQALRLGVARFGASALGDGPGLDREVIIARAAGEGQMQQVLVQVLNSIGDRATVWAQVLVDVLNDQKSVMDRLTLLHAIPDRSSAIPFERYLLNQLSSADRISPPAMKIEADDMLESGKLSDAAPLLEKLSPSTGATKPDPRILFWRAWAATAGDDQTGANLLFNQLRQSFPDNPWAKEAAELSPTAGVVELSLQKNVEAALTASRGFKRGIDLLEAQLQYTRSDGQKVDIYTGFNAGKQLEIQVKHGNDVGLVYRATDADASIYTPGYTPGDAALLHFTKPALLPVPLFGMGRVDNDYLFQASFKFSTSFDDVQTALTNLAATDFLSTREGLQDFLRSFVRKGIFPQPPQAQADGSTLYEWINPQIDTPTYTKVSVTVAPSGNITALQAGGFAISSLRYGPAGTFALSSPPLPQVTVKEVGQMNTAILQQALTIFMAQFSPPPPRPPATQPVAQASAKPAGTK
jgi:hypothetical protein